MTQITFKGNPLNTVGTLPNKGNVAPKFSLVGLDLRDMELKDFSGKKVLNIFPSIDTPVCATSVRKFNEHAASKPGVVVLNISADLPFAQQRFCGAEGIDKVVMLSSFRSNFATDYGLQIADGPLAGLCSRAVIVLDEQNRVVYTQQVKEIAEEPDYEAALAVL